MKTIKLAIKDFVEFIGRSGSISNDFTSPTRAIEGTRIHQMIQKKQKENYFSEYHVSYTKVYDEFEIILSGRADGLIIDNDSYTIDEIKSTTKDLDSLKKIDTIPNHLNQAKCYAYIIAEKKQLKTIDIQLTYCQVDTHEIKQLKETFSIDKLKKHLDNLFNQYYEFALLNINHLNTRTKSIKTLSFPFPTYRKGQRELAVSIYNTIKQEQNIFLLAATGIGKTISSLYPAIKSMEKGYTSKIMYLTAKTITRSVAEDTVKTLINLNVKLRTVSLTAKDKICFLEKSNCHPDYCPYAINHYNRVNQAIIDCLKQEQLMDRITIEKYAMKHQVCPFELSLDLFLFCDISISDYNYAFDPKVALKRAENEKSNYTLLVDEAHNLVDRAKEMYSAVLSKEIIMEAKRKAINKKGPLYNSIQKLNKFMINYKQTCQDNYQTSKDAPIELIEPINNFIKQARNYLTNSIKDAYHQALLDLYFHCLDFLRIIELYNDDYITYIENSLEDTIIKLFCLNPSLHLKNNYQQVKSVILFSATLLPIQYFYNLLGGKKPNQKLYFPSPFPASNKCLLLANDVSTKYHQREHSYQKIIHYIKSLITSKKGHYLIYFPSYAYMHQVLNILDLTTIDSKIYVQQPFMSEIEKEKYLNTFKKIPNKNRLFFSVLGGVFSEGIDLKGQSLIGVMIVSVGLPKIGLERELIKQHFNQDNQGFLYSYIYPGFNKVMQAAGRVIRTMSDQGVILLVDERYLNKQYLQLFPIEWQDYKVTNQKLIIKDLIDFWNK